MRVLASSPLTMWLMAALSAADRCPAMASRSVNSSPGSPKWRPGHAVDEQVVGGHVEDLGEADHELDGGGHLAVLVAAYRGGVVGAELAMIAAWPGQHSCRIILSFTRRSTTPGGIGTTC